MTHRYNSWTDRISDKMKLDKPAWMRIGLTVGLAVLISSMILLGVAVTKGPYNEDMAAVRGNVAGLGAKVNVLSANVTTIAGYINSILALGPLATKAQVDSAASKATANAGSISTLQTRMSGAEARITAVEADNTLEVYLTGTSGNYTLHAKSSDAGNFTANVNLVYADPVSAGNATTYDEAIQAFYGSINWTASAVPDYACTLTYNSTAWGVSQVWFNIGTFSLAANNETTVGIAFGGPDFSYVEVFPVLKNG